MDQHHEATGLVSHRLGFAPYIVLGVDVGRLQIGKKHLEAILRGQTSECLSSGVLSLSLLALSALQLRIVPGEARSEATETSAKITVPLQVSNGGFLPVRSLALQTTVSGKDSEPLAEGKTGPLDIPPGSKVEVPVSITLDLQSVKPEVLSRLLFNDEAFTGDIRGSLSVEPLISVTLSARTTLQWGAPLYGLEVASPVLSQHNSTHVKAEVAVSFGSRSPYLAVDAQAQARIFNATSGDLQGLGELPAKASPGSSFNGSLTSFITLEPAGLSALLFNSTTLRYGAVLSATSMGHTFTVERLFTYQWEPRF